MSAIVEKVKALTLPKGDYVVIGSGLLDALGLRSSRDLDLAVSHTLYNQLLKSGTYQEVERHGVKYLEAGDVEIWQQWMADYPFERLLQTAYEHEGVVFAHPDVIIDHKTQRGLPKDKEDIRLLKEYFNYE